MDNVQRYLQINKNLIQTMIIKSELHASLLNDEIKLKHPNIIIDENDPSTWMYYLNLAGMQHELNSDIYITSFDTQEEILFNSYNLRIHKQTRSKYLMGTKNYYIMLKNYPNEELFINGSIYPVDIDIAISSKDLQILRFDESLVEPQEINLISELQNFIYSYDTRWNVKAFIESDDLYPAAQYAIFILNLLQKLINIRLNKCKTNEVHSFHIKEYLTGHYRLNSYVNYMTTEQIMFIYKNIKYIQRNTGKVETFITLVNKLLEERGLIPLREIAIKHKHELQDNLLPVIYNKKQELTTTTNASITDMFDMDTLDSLCEPIALDNKWQTDTYKDVPRHMLATNNTNTTKTKFLLSDIIDFGDLTNYPLQEVLLKHWVATAFSGRYNIYISFFSQLVNKEIYMHVTDAFLYMLYLVKSYYNQDNDIIPEFINSKRLKYVKPTVDELLALVPSDQKRHYSDIAEEIIYNAPIYIAITDTEKFNSFCYDIYKYAYWHWILISNTHDISRRAYVKAMCDHMFVDENITINTKYTRFNEIIRKYDLTPQVTNVKRSIELIADIYNASTGYIINEYTKIVNIHDKMIDMLATLSSYSITYLKHVNENKIYLAEWAAIRTGNNKMDILGTIYSPLNIDIIDTSINVKNNYEYNIHIPGSFNTEIGFSLLSYYEMLDIDSSIKHISMSANIDNSIKLVAELTSSSINNIYDITTQVLNSGYSIDSITNQYTYNLLTIKSDVKDLKMYNKTNVSINASNGQNYDHYIESVSPDVLNKILNLVI